MIIIMKPTATQADVQTICDWITSLRYQPRVTTSTRRPSSSWKRSPPSRKSST